MKEPDNIAAIAGALTAAQRKALREYRPGMWYGRAKPSIGASFCKGVMCDHGLLEHDGAAPESSYRLTPLGVAVRDHRASAAC